MQVEDHRKRRDKIEGWDVEIATYRIGDTYHCHIDNVSPGATVARGEGKSAAAAEKDALEKARPRFAATRRVTR
ncbi:MAG: hypothetical protein HY721_18735 [Planctomycetes bacterium]|nr:hypothetical protein [Planctomycetota bacterium]